MSNDDNTILRKRLQNMLRVVPPSVNAGSYQLSLKFKEWAEKTNKAIVNPRSNNTALQSLINQYESFK